MAVRVFQAISPDDWDSVDWHDAVGLLKDFNIKKFILCPNHWREYKNLALRWQKVKFDANGVKKLPNDKQGVYSFLVQPNIGGHAAISYLLYIGETTKQTLRARCSAYLTEPKSKNARVPVRSMIRKWPDHLWLYFAVVDDVTIIKQLEEDLLKAYLPPYNQSFTATVGKAGKLQKLLKEVFEMKNRTQKKQASTKAKLGSRTPHNKALGPLRLPAMNCRMGDRGYLLTAMTLREVAERVVGDVRTIHPSEKLAKWIQRVLKKDHAAGIATYLDTEKSRFFNALVIGVYGGDPLWSDLTVADPHHELTDDEEERVNASIGVLILTGEEQLFAIDGQHRVAGIKQAVTAGVDFGDEEIAVILVGHANTALGMQRTRRLFVTLNQRARRVSDADIVALDEDNGVAVITRRIIDEGTLFPREGLIVIKGSVAIRPAEPKALTSILGLYQILKGLYPRAKTFKPEYKKIMRSRPSDEELDVIHELAVRYWKALIKEVPEYKKAIQTGSINAGDYRTAEKNHLLFRPAGQHAMAKATECLLSRGESVEAAVRVLIRNNEMDLLNSTWHSILWDPDTKKMLNESLLAETLLLTNAHREARTPDAQQKLDIFLNDRKRK